MALKRKPPTQRYVMRAAFEAAVVYYTCAHQGFYDIVGGRLDPEAMPSEEAALVVKAAQACAKEAAAAPGSAVIVLQMLQRWMDVEGSLALEDFQKAVTYLEACEDLPQPDEVSTRAALVPLVQDRMSADLRVSVVATAPGQRGVDALPAIVKRIQAITALGKDDESLGLDCSRDALAALDISADVLPTRIPQLDAVLGGLRRGCFGLFIGGSGDGKSVSLGHVAVQNMLAGKSVLYATLELSAEDIFTRMISSVTGIPMRYIQKGDASFDPVVQARAIACYTRLCRERGAGPQHIKYFNPRTTTCAMLETWWRRCEIADGGRKVDLLVVDYADKMSAGGGKHDENTYQAGGIVTDGLRSLAVDNDCWVWSASQAKRGAGRAVKGNKKDKRVDLVDLQDVADSQQKINNSDLIVTLNRSERTDEGGGMMTVYCGKNRKGQGDFVAGPWMVDFACGRIVITPDPEDGGMPAVTGDMREV